MIDFKDVRFTYDGQKYVLDGVSLHIEQGSFVCILGGNGSGKSTLAKHINALLVPDEGTVDVLGKRTSDPKATFFIRSNAGMVFQNPDDQLVASLIENDVAFGPENLGLPPEELRKRVTESLEAVGLQGFEKKETNALSGGQKQRVAIAGMLAMQPQILVLDEASAMLDPRGRTGLMRVCKELNEAGMTIVMITHFMEEAALADVVYVLDGGKIVLSGTPEYVLGRVEEMEERSLDIPFAARLSYDLKAAGIPVSIHVDEENLLDDLTQKCKGAPHAMEEMVLHEQRGQLGKAEPDRPTIEFRDVWFAYDPRAAERQETTPSQNTTRTDWGNAPDSLWALQEVSFSLQEGEFFGIAGHTGSGKSTLVQHMNGLLSPTRGQVLVNGVDIAEKHAASEARKNVGLVFQYPEHQLFAASVYEDVAFGPRNMGVGEDEMDTVVRQALELVDLDFDTLRSLSPFELSGGQQRRVALAGVLAMQPKTLILDEPAAGLDPVARRELLALVQGLHKDLGNTIVFISHNMDDLALLSDRILVLNTGHVHALGTPAEVFANADACKRIGLDVPAPQRFARELSRRGITLAIPEGGLFTQQSLVEACRSAYKEGR